jgi:probable F420-dependent oxidoreductase
MPDNKRKFRFGVSAVGNPESATAFREFARKAEDQGYDVILMSDHMGRGAAPLIGAMAALAATTRLRLGTQVLANDFRNPVVLAKEIATLDLLSEGRFELGIGVGWPSTSETGRADSAQTGIPLAETGVRVERFGESVRIIKQFLSSDEPFDFPGKHFNLKNVAPFPRPVQKPRPPIMVAGAGPRLMRFAAKEADIINIAPRPPIKGTTPRGSTGYGLTMADEVSLIMEAAGDRYGEVELCVFANNPNAGNPSITDNPGPLLEKLAGDLGTTPEVANEMPATLIGSEESLIERLQRHRDEYDISYRVIPAYAMDAFAPIVARLAGT